jgi:SAM-dependent methyltransferase
VDETAGFAVRSQSIQSFPALSSAIFVPRRYRPGNLRTWSGHLPFARDLIASLQPRLLVELGTHFGESYFGFCQSVEEAGVACACYAVDSWRGDPHAGTYGEEVFEEVNRYNDQWYGAFSHLLRTYFDDAQWEFSDGSIDLLHIDGLHTYAAVKHDWNTWFPKVAPGGIVLLHDIGARHLDFGVWKLWDELSIEYESFDFHHYNGLGVIRKPGSRKSHAGVLDYLFSAENEETIRRYYVLCSRHLDSKADLEGIGDRSSCQVFQLYYPENGVFSEKASMSALVEPGPWRKLTFDLAGGLDGEVLRLDLGGRPAIIDVGSVAFFHAFDHRELWRCSPRGEGRSHFALDGTASLLPDESVLAVFSFGNDPQMLVSVPNSVPRSEPLIFESWVRLDHDLSRLATRGSVVAKFTRDHTGLLTRPQTGVADSVRRRPFVDLGNEITQAISEAQAEGVDKGFLPLPLADPALPRNDWKPAKNRSNSCRALTPDPWIACPIDLNSAAARFFAMRLSCSSDGHNPHAQLFWTSRNDPGFKERFSIQFPVLADGKQHLYVVDMHSPEPASAESGLWQDSGPVTGVRLDPVDKPSVFDISFAGFVMQGQSPDELIRKALGLPPLRGELANRYLRGSGIEIGALQKPLPLPPEATVHYVDRLTLEAARSEFSELGDIPLVTPTIITDAGTLSAIPSESYDFCVACNVIEHMRDPIGTLRHWLRVLKTGGILFIECPNHENFMDKLRPVTPMDHLIADHVDRESRGELDRQHYFECVSSTHDQLPEQRRTEIAERYYATNYAVHFHTFDADSFRDLLGFVQSLLPFVIEEYHVLRDPELIEFVSVLRKL